MDVNQKIDIAGPFGIPLGSFTPDPLSNLLPRQTVRIKATVPAIAAAVLAWSTVTLSPGAIGTAGKAPNTGSTASPTSPTAASAPTPTKTADAITVTDKDTISFVEVSSTVATLAVSWTLLALVLVVIAAAYLIWRYVSGTRERMYAAIDEAAAAARAEQSSTPPGSDRS
jgi:hypothetical protein